MKLTLHIIAVLAITLCVSGSVSTQQGPPIGLTNDAQSIEIDGPPIVDSPPAK